MTQIINTSDNTHGPCNKLLECGHKCYGIQSSDNCLPCLEADCLAHKGVPVTKDELCAICYCSELSDEPCVALSCGHVFHANCVKQLLEHKWNGLKISFAFMSCPSCKTPIESLDCVEAQETLE